jgi:ubiquinone/menaquinone biosynthesis C-methylase UbiE
MNEAHRNDFADPERGREAMQGIRWMIEHHGIGGRSIALGDHVLEIGAAFGSTTALLRHEVTKLTAVEMDPVMAASAAERLAGTNAEVVNMDATELPFDDDAFSAAVCTYVLHHVPSPTLQDEMLAEAARVLVPGGVFFGWDSLDGPEIREYHAGDVFVPIDGETFADRLRRAGFGEVNVGPDDEEETLFFAATT